MPSNRHNCGGIIEFSDNEGVRQMAQGFGKRVLKPQEQREAKILKQSVLKHFQDLEDPRVERGQHHPLVSLVSIAILATLAGADSFVAIERYGIAKQSWLETFLELPYGIPSHDTFGRVMAMLSPAGGVGEAVSGLGQWHE